MPTYVGCSFEPATVGQRVRSASDTAAWCSCAASSLLSSRACAALTRAAAGSVIALLDNSTRPPREFVDASLGALRAHPSELLHAARTDQLFREIEEVAIYPLTLTP